jgi:hypothetical protein
MLVVDKHGSLVQVLSVVDLLEGIYKSSNDVRRDVKTHLTEPFHLIELYI